jgi:RND family efflux transporter MFP subunit
MPTKLVHNIAAVTKVLFARLRFLSVFIVAAFVVGYWDEITNHFDKWTRPATAPEVAGVSHSDTEYFCPMHPNIIRDQVGTCPICGMDLIKRAKGQPQALPKDVLARVQLSPQRLALANVQTTAVEYRTLVHEIHALGVLDYDETRVARLSARIAGRVDELYITYTGQAVKQGDRVYSLYSPDVYTAQREYLLARKRVNDLPADASPQVRADASAVYNATMQKLVLWGISSDQLEQMDHEFDASGKIPTHLVVTSPISGIVVEKTISQGDYVQAGNNPYTLADLTTLWLRVKIYERDAAMIQVGQEAMLVAEAYPNETFKGVVSFVAFQLDPQTRTFDARVEVRNDDLRLRPGMFADARINLSVMPSTGPAPTTNQAPAAATASTPKAFLEALLPYLKAQKLLAHDQSGEVSMLLHQSLAALAPVKSDAELAGDYERFEKAVHSTMGQNLESIRETFKEVSLAMINLGKDMKLPADAPTIQVFRCPMKKSSWLQEAGATLNPFYGTSQSMQDCGGPVESLPRANVSIASSAPRYSPAGKTLSIPRSAVIDTGRRKIVYVEDTPGIYDMHEVELGNPTDAYYPVIAGLTEGDRVVTNGAFLIDAENRLNPVLTTENMKTTEQKPHVH